MTDIDKTVVAPQLRLTSDSFNDGDRLHDRILLELVSAMQLGDAYKVAAAGIGGVLSGLEVRAITGTLTVEVSPGIAFVAQTPTSTLYDPPINIIELRAATIVDLAPYVDGANPRLVTIEIEPQLVGKVTENVDKFNATGDGSFSPVSVDTVVGSDPIITVRAGTATPDPQIAPGPGVEGQLPLAIVKLSTALAFFLDDYVSVLLCRPMLSALGNTIVDEGSVAGRGISVGEEFAGALQGLFAPEIHDTRLKMNGLPARVRGTVPFAGTIYARTPKTTDPVTLLTSTGPVYGYVVPPPWPDDYGAGLIAPRESRVLNPNSIALTSPESVVFGDGTTFVSLGLGSNGIVGPTFENCIPIWDDQPPSGFERGPLGTAPPRVMNPLGPTTGSLTLDETQDLAWGNAQVVTESVYIGAVSATGGQFIAQSYRGEGVIDYIDQLDIAAGTGAMPVRLDVADVLTAPFVIGAFPSMEQGGLEPDILPFTASKAKLGLTFAGGNANAVVSIGITGVFGSGNPDPIGLGGFRLGLDNTSQPAFARDARFEIGLNAGHQANIGALLTAGGASTTLWLSAYTDALLASR